MTQQHHYVCRVARVKRGAERVDPRPSLGARYILSQVSCREEVLKMWMTKTNCPTAIFDNRSLRQVAHDRCTIDHTREVLNVLRMPCLEIRFSKSIGALTKNCVRKLG